MRRVRLNGHGRNICRRLSYRTKGIRICYGTVLGGVSAILFMSLLKAGDRLFGQFVRR